MTPRDAAQLANFDKFQPRVIATGLRTYSVKRWPTMNHEWRKQKLASMLGMKPRRLRSYWDAEDGLHARMDEVEAISALLSKPESEIEEATRDAFRELQARVARLERLLADAGADGAHPPMARGRQETHG